MRRLIPVVLGVLAATAVASAGTAKLPTPNLLQNPGAEAGAAADTATVPVPGWQTAGGATAAAYGDGTIRPKAFPGSGKKFFIGGVAGAQGLKNVSTATQVVDISSNAAAIDKKRVALVLSGMLGGYAGQDDYAMLRAVFIDAKGKPISRLDVIGPKDAQRKGRTILLPQKGTALVPVGARKIRVSIVAFWLTGSGSDGSADNVSAVLTTAASR